MFTLPLDVSNTEQGKYCILYKTEVFEVYSSHTQCVQYMIKFSNSSIRFQLYHEES
jgi:hypothetical protein